MKAELGKDLIRCLTSSVWPSILGCGTGQESRGRFAQRAMWLRSSRTRTEWRGKSADSRGGMIGKQKGRGASAAVREEQDMNPAQEKAPPGRNAGTRAGCRNNFDLLDKGGNGTLADGPDRADGRGTS